MLHQSLHKISKLTKLNKASIRKTVMPLCAIQNILYPSSFKHRDLSTDGMKCWNCNSSHTYELLCPSCNRVQCTGCTSNQINYFQLFKLKESFDISRNSLKPYYLKLQTLLHPDKFANTSQLEKDYSTTQSALINEAYKTLIEPLKRGLYMLKLNGYELESEVVDSETANQELLNDIFMLNFQVDDCDDITELQEISTDIEIDIENDIQAINEAFHENDFLAAKSHLIRMKYRSNIKMKLDDKMLDLSL